MKRTALALLVLIVVCGGIRAEGLPIEKIKNPGVNYVPAAEPATTKTARRQLPRALPEHLRTSFSLT